MEFFIYFLFGSFCLPTDVVLPKMAEEREVEAGISNNRLENPWKHVREVATTLDKLSGEFMSFQHQNLPTSHPEGLNEIRSHYWGHGQASIIREKLFMPAKKGLNWSLSPRNGNGGGQQLTYNSDSEQSR